MQWFLNKFWHGSRVQRHFSEIIHPSLQKVSTTMGITYKSIALLLFILLFLVTAFHIDYWSFASVSSGSSSSKLKSGQPHKDLNHSRTRIHYSLNCITQNQTQICPRYIKQIDQDYQTTISPSCPNYFSWIHEDLQPWKEMGITREMVEKASRMATFRLVVLNGKAYVQVYKSTFQTRDIFTLWGILQLLKLYPGNIPDLDLMFNCDDRPVILSSDYKENGYNSTSPPPLFHYCGSNDSLDIPFPDWSFWGWPETNIKPWVSLLKELNEANKKVKWMDREPYAYWRGNPYVAKSRIHLLECNISDEQDWNARIYEQDWTTEDTERFEHSNLVDQCVHRYKIYIEGYAWSVSQKYILACNSPTLLVKPQYYDILTRGLVPMHHYWPIKENDQCRSIKFAVEWGNIHTKEAQEIGRTGSNFIVNELSMEYVYDYMFHLLNEYAKLLRYKPSIPENAIEYCTETMACGANGLERKFMIESMVESPSETKPCNMPPPMDYLTIKSLIRRNANAIQQVEMWENKYRKDKPIPL